MCPLQPISGHQAPVPPGDPCQAAWCWCCGDTEVQVASWAWGSIHEHPPKAQGPLMPAHVAHSERSCKAAHSLGSAICHSIATACHTTSLLDRGDAPGSLGSAYAIAWHMMGVVLGSHCWQGWDWWVCSCMGTPVWCPGTSIPRHGQECGQDIKKHS